jgi:RecB family endonuclease NucS
VRLVIARCSLDYTGRLSAHLPLAVRLILIKADGSVLIHSDTGTKALNWMPAGSRMTVAEASEPDLHDGPSEPLDWISPPCRLIEKPGQWTVTNKTGEILTISIEEIVSDTSHDLGTDPGLIKDGVESQLQQKLAEQLGVLGEGWRLIRREYPTAIGPVDLMCRDGEGVSVAVEIKRRGEIDGVEQLTRYLELLNRDPLLAPVRGVFAAQEIRPQARVLAEDRGIRCVILDYDALRGAPSSEMTLF